MSKLNPGLIVLLGSGETLPSSSKTHEYVAQRLPEDPYIVILETPAGFEPNSDLVADKIKQFLLRRLQNIKPRIDVLPVRKKETYYSPNNAEIIDPILEADEILLGPGSPSYGARQLRGTLAADYIGARQRLGATLFLSSSATLAFGKFTIPVYEIYKVGEDLHWKLGVDYFAAYGLPLSVVPHWNNTDGGKELDTSRCYMGQARFDGLLDLLPPGQLIVGLDEHTSLILDFDSRCCHIVGNGSVHILHDGRQRDYATGARFDLDELGDWHLPTNDDLKPDVWQRALARVAQLDEQPQPSADVLALVEQRTAARQRNDWEMADKLRDRVLSLGWQVDDTATGPEITPVG